MRQKELLAWLKLIIGFCGIFGLLFCIYIGLETGKGFLLHAGELAVLYNPFVGFIWITDIPFFIALVLGWKICSDISIDKAFTFQNADRLKKISILSIIEGVLYAVPLCYLFVSGSYHTNILIVLLLILFFTVVISVFTSMLCYLDRKASEVKQDNDLTI